MLENFPNEYQIFCQQRDEILMEKIQTKYKALRCSFCSRSSHFSSQCSFYHIKSSMVRGKESEEEEQSDLPKNRKSLSRFLQRYNSLALREDIVEGALSHFMRAPIDSLADEEFYENFKNLTFSAEAITSRNSITQFSERQFNN